MREIGIRITGLELRKKFWGVERKTQLHKGPRHAPARRVPWAAPLMVDLSAREDNSILSRDLKPTNRAAKTSLEAQAPVAPLVQQVLRLPEAVLRGLRVHEVVVESDFQSGERVTGAHPVANWLKNIRGHPVLLPLSPLHLHQKVRQAPEIVLRLPSRRRKGG